MAEAKLNPSLFEKLTLNDRVTGIIEEGRAGTGGRAVGSRDEEGRCTGGPRVMLKTNHSSTGKRPRTLWHPHLRKFAQSTGTLAVSC